VLMIFTCYADYFLCIDAVLYIRLGVFCLKSSRTTIVTTHKSCISIESIIKVNYD
jgi:hypothetical protein